MIPTAPRSVDLESNKAERWAVRRRILSTPEAVAAFAIDVPFLLMLFAQWGSIVGLIIGIIVLGITMAASMTGESTAFTFLSTLIRTVSFPATLAGLFPAADWSSITSAVPLTVAMWLVYFQLELAHLAAGHRRDAVISAEVRIGRLLMVGLVGVLSVITAIMLQAINSDTERSWVWVPIAGAAILGLVACSAVIAIRKRGRHDNRHWVPGERLLPPARG